MSKPISTTKLSETLTLSVYPANSGHAGFWLYDKSQGLNLAIREESREAALLKALEYYQKRATAAEVELNRLDMTVKRFLRDLRAESDPDKYGFWTNCRSED